MLANLAAEVYAFESSTHVVAGRNLSPRQAYEHVRAFPFEPLGNTRLANCSNRSRHVQQRRLTLTRTARDAARP